ncbi:DUF4810 domain-containing protein [Actinobacillus equuli subsp. haemolyticus]|uniref:DUF4810 domain-containing protein n=1 Tax=Actinobacillus equuli TaxID=718 RepID=UPI00244235EA|nr:DUF4810 domain-containing protein [Actinobacillus equuli]WGE71018.1 DUF4810 domain-containing protein [Actinobacillus equuli subsp. haemolyticus]
MKKVNVITFALMAMILSACYSKSVNTQYYWGNYSDIIYSYYNEPNDFVKQENGFNEIIKMAKDANKPVAPGVYGHLGLVLLKQGKTAEAQNAFIQEQQLFPESKTFMQYLQRKK